jgi:hypothetical protein
MAGSRKLFIVQGVLQLTCAETELEENHGQMPAAKPRWNSTMLQANGYLRGEKETIPA